MDDILKNRLLEAEKATKEILDKIEKSDKDSDENVVCNKDKKIDKLIEWMQIKNI